MFHRLMSHGGLVLVPFAVTFTVSFASAADEATQRDFFETKIRPVLVKECYDCHSQSAQSQKKLKGSLLLDTKEGVRKGGDTGPSLVAGKPNESLLIQALRYKDPNMQMPPRGKLPDGVIADFEKWVAEGAFDPREQATGDAKPQAVDIEKGKEFWAFRPVQKPALPAVKNTSWSQRPLDQFVLAQLEARQLKPNGQASKRDWIRRATFDLIGLPPTPEEVADFENDTSSTARAKVIDRLLASPHYGERWARYWLDVARYAEDQAHTFAVKKYTNAHLYRDWVVQALNKDMPYDRFVKLQLAGDLLPSENGDLFERLGGLGFMGLGLNYYKNNDMAQAIADELDDRVDTVTRGFLGLTVSCARCHDHKFDPVPQYDYYAIAGVFNGSRFADMPIVPSDVVAAYDAGQKRIKDAEAKLAAQVQVDRATMGKAELPKFAKYLATAWRVRTLQQRKAKIDVGRTVKEAELSPMYFGRILAMLDLKNAKKAPPELEFLFRETPELAAVADAEVQFDEKNVAASESVQQMLIAAVEQAEAIEAAKKPGASADKSAAKPKPLTKEQERLLKTLWTDQNAPFAIPEKEVRTKATREEAVAAVYKTLDTAIDDAKKAAPPRYAEVHVLAGGGNPMKVYIRGNPHNPGVDARKGFLQVMGHAAPSAAAGSTSGTGTATPPGATTPASPPATPTTPAATDAKNPADDFNRLRLAEAIASADNPLTPRVIVNRVWQYHFGRGLVATTSNFGLLGDRPTHPELLDWLTKSFVEQNWSLKALHREIMLSATYGLSSEHNTDNAQIDADNVSLWRMPRRRLDVEAFRDAILAASGTLDRTLGGPMLDLSDTKNRRRTVYGRISRHQPHRLLTLFDFPDANVTSGTRTVTTVPQQQLFVLNSRFITEQAQAFADRLQKEAATDPDRIRLGFQWAYGRNPTETESQAIVAFLAEASKETTGNALSPWAQVAQALLSANEFTYID